VTAATESIQDTIQDTILQNVAEQFISHDFSRVKNGETVPDEDKMKAKVFELVRSKVVTTKDEKSKKSWTNGELYAQTFPGAPGTDPKQNLDLLDLVEAEVRKHLMRKVWGLTQPARNGYVQKRLGDDGSLVLCRGTVMRGLDDATGVFVTDNADLIMSESLQPQIEGLVKKADNLRLHADMIRTRHPELEARMTNALGLGVRRTIAALPEGGSVSETAAKTDGKNGK
jgi:hypothetical protein